MSQVWIRSDEAARGSTPARCAKTGERCITRWPLRARDLPAALEWSTWTDLWPRNAPHDPPRVVVSLLPGVERTHRWLALTRDLTTIAILLGLLLAAFGDGSVDVFALTAVLLLVGLKAVVAIVGVLWAVDVRADVSGEWLLLSRVHADFAASVESGLTRPSAAPVLPETESTVTSWVRDLLGRGSTATSDSA